MQDGGEQPQIPFTERPCSRAVWIYPAEAEKIYECLQMVCGHAFQLSAADGILLDTINCALMQQTEEKISAMLEALPEILKDDGYPDVQAFMATYRKAEAVVDNYNRELAEWERNVKESRRPTEKERYVPPEKQSVRDQLKRLQTEGRQPKSKHRSHDRER